MGPAQQKAATESFATAPGANVREIPQQVDPSTLTIPSARPTYNVYPPTPTAQQEAIKEAPEASPLQAGFLGADIATGGLGAIPQALALNYGLPGLLGGGGEPTGALPPKSGTQFGVSDLPGTTSLNPKDLGFGLGAKTMPDFTSGGYLPGSPTRELGDVWGRQAGQTEPLNVKSELPVYVGGKPPEYLYHGLGVPDYDARRLREEAMTRQRGEVLPGIVDTGLGSGWFSDYPLAGYGPVHLAVKTEDLPQYGEWGNPHAQGFVAAGEAKFHTYRPWDINDEEMSNIIKGSSTLENAKAELENFIKTGGGVSPDKIHLADAQGNIVAPLVDEKGNFHPLAEKWLNAKEKNLTGMIYPSAPDRPISGGLPTQKLPPSTDPVAKMRLHELLGGSSDVGSDIARSGMVSELMQGMPPKKMVSIMEDEILPQVKPASKMLYKSIINSLKKNLPEIEELLKGGLKEAL